MWGEKCSYVKKLIPQLLEKMLGYCLNITAQIPKGNFLYAGRHSIRYWWPAGYRGTPKVFLYTGKILQVVSLFTSAFLVSICYVIKHVMKHLLRKLINEPEVDFVM